MLNNSNLYGSEWLALVFSNRNKNYGAFVLRSQSSNILVRALLIVAPLFILLFVGPMIYAHFKPKEDTQIDVIYDLKTVDPPIHEMEKKKDDPKKEEQAKPLPTKPIEQNTVKLTSNIQVVDQPDVEPLTMAQVQNAVVSNVTQSGESGGLNAAPVANTGGGGGGSADGVDVNVVYDQYGVDSFPEFPGGMDAWGKFLQRNLRYSYAAQDAGIQGKVFVSFVVERDGSISDVKIVKGIGYGLDDEAIRVIKKSPRWKAGMQNKQAVRVRYNMPINYVLSQ